MSLGNPNDMDWVTFLQLACKKGLERDGLNEWFGQVSLSKSIIRLNLTLYSCGCQLFENWLTACSGPGKEIYVASRSFLIGRACILTLRHATGGDCLVRLGRFGCRGRSQYQGSHGFDRSIGRKLREYVSCLAFRVDAFANFSNFFIYDESRLERCGMMDKCTCTLPLYSWLETKNQAIEFRNRSNCLDEQTIPRYDEITNLDIAMRWLTELWKRSWLRRDSALCEILAMSAKAGEGSGPERCTPYGAQEACVFKFQLKIGAAQLHGKLWFQSPGRGRKIGNMLIRSYSNERGEELSP